MVIQYVSVAIGIKLVIGMDLTRHMTATAHGKTNGLEMCLGVPQRENHPFFTYIVFSWGGDPFGILRPGRCSTNTPQPQPFLLMSFKTAKKMRAQKALKPKRFREEERKKNGHPKTHALSTSASLPHGA